MRLSQPFAFESLPWINVRGNRRGLRNSRCRNRRGAAAIPPADVHCQIESLEARLLLTVNAPASATVLENSTLVFSQTPIGILTTRARAGELVELTLSVSHGT